MSNLRRAAAMLLSLCFLGACTHPHRVARRQLTGLAKRGDRFVLVFGSVKTLDGASAAIIKGASDRASIRFIHKDASAESILREIGITSGDRFYALLKAPATAKYLDHFDAEVRWANRAYDKVTHIKLREAQGGSAMYIGEIEMRVSAAGPSEDPKRPTPKQMVWITVQDDFGGASGELRRLYPSFGGRVLRSPLLQGTLRR